MPQSTPASKHKCHDQAPFVRLDCRKPATDVCWWELWAERRATMHTHSNAHTNTHDHGSIWPTQWRLLIYAQNSSEEIIMKMHHIIWISHANSANYSFRILFDIFKWTRHTCLYRWFHDLSPELKCDRQDSRLVHRDQSQVSEKERFFEQIHELKKE